MGMTFKRMFVFLLLVLTAGAVSGCNTLADAKMAKGKGDFKVYQAPAEKIWEAMPGVVKSVGLDYVSDNRDEGYVLAQRGISAFSYGESVAIFISSLENQKTRVEVVSKKAMSTNIFAPNWSKKLFQTLDAAFTPAEEAVQ